MKMKVKAYVYMAQNYINDEWEPAVWKCRVDDSKREIFISEQILEVEIPDDFQPVPLQIEILKEAAQKIRAEAHAKVQNIEEQIQSLLCLENKA